MILISHRGNLDGQQSDKENHPNYIFEAIKQGFHVEVDVWFIEGKFKLGHDEPQYDFPLGLLEYHSKNLWIHAKNLEAISQLNILDKTGVYLNYFWHQKDDVTITSKGYLWAYPGKDVENSIAVMPEIHSDNLNNRIGVCSDNIVGYE